MLSCLVPAMRAAALGLALVPALWLSADAHEGHDHGAPVQTAPAHALPRGIATAGDLELVAVARGDTLMIYLDRIATNDPIEHAAIEVESPDGSVMAEPQPDGSYRLAALWLLKGGHVDLIATVTVDGNVEVLPLTLDLPAVNAQADVDRGLLTRAGVFAQPALLIAGGIGFGLGIMLMAMSRRRIALALFALIGFAAMAAPSLADEGHSHDEPAPTIARGGPERAQRLPDQSIFVPKPVQRLFSLRTIVLQSGAFPRTVELPGRAIPDPGSSGFVQTAIGGRLSAPPGGFPRLGAPVREGDVLAYVTPPIQQIDVSDMRQRQGELDQQIAIVERRLARFDALGPSGAVARAQIEETRLELDGLKDRRAALDRIRLQPEALVAPVAGVIADGMPVAGQIAQPGAMVFHIVDPAKIWIEALSFDTFVSLPTASARTAAGQTLALSYRGAGLAGRNQAVPIHFEVDHGASQGLRAGQFVTVSAQSAEVAKGLAVPRSALVRAANGQDVVYEHTAAERFEPRAVRVQPLDAERVLLMSGVEPGRRIVVQGAELLDHVR